MLQMIHVCTHYLKLSTSPLIVVGWSAGYVDRAGDLRPSQGVLTSERQIC